MTQETLKKANELLKELEECKMNLDIAKNTAPLKYPLREDSFKTSYFFRYGSEKSFFVPKCSYMTIVKMIIEEYEKRVAELQKELDEL